MVSLSRNLDICYIDNFLNLLESGKKTLANNFIISEIFFITRIQTHCTNLTHDFVNYRITQLEAVAQKCSVKKVLLEISQNSQEN